MWFSSRKILRATAVASPLRGRPEMRHPTSVRFRDLALGKRPAVFAAIINQVDGNALSRSRHLQLLIQFNRYCRIDRLQRSRLALHARRHRNWQSACPDKALRTNRKAGCPSLSNVPREGARLSRRSLRLSGLFRRAWEAIAYPWRSFRPALIGSWDY